MNYDINEVNKNDILAGCKPGVYKPSGSCFVCPPYSTNQAWVIENQNYYYSVTLACGPTRVTKGSKWCINAQVGWSCGPTAGCGVNYETWKQEENDEIKIPAGQSSSCSAGQQIAVDGGWGSSVWPSTVELSLLDAKADLAGDINNEVL